MKLLNTQSLKLEEFTDDATPPYAILSHRWQKQELSFRDLKPKYAQSLASKPGYDKVYHFCKTALRDGFDYGWVDTVCIDKRSSAELSEAINSMFHWYQDAAICYVYMNTVPGSASRGEMEGAQLQAFRCSDWFTRGWTLQELLGPERVVFLDRRWTMLGTKDSLAKEISRITTIEESYLTQSSRLTFGGYGDGYPCVATRMSWASMRITSRKEDVAYCLLGLFDINMPLLYGEGTKAFSRLQQEIIRKTDDETIFGWRGGTKSCFQEGVPSSKSFLAPSPEAFADSQGFRPSSSSGRWMRPPYSITNRGIEFFGELIEAKPGLIKAERSTVAFQRNRRLLPLTVSLAADADVICALAVFEEGPSYPGSGGRARTKRLQRVDPDAIYECYWENRGTAPIITTIKRTIPGHSMERYGAISLTDKYLLPIASNPSSRSMHEVFYLCLNEPQDLYGMFKAQPGRSTISAVGTASSVMGSGDSNGTSELDLSHSDSSQITKSTRAQSFYHSERQREHERRDRTKRIYIPSAQRPRANAKEPKDNDGRHGLPRRREIPSGRVSSRRRERRLYE